MRKYAIVAAGLLVSLVLGATVFSEPIASAAQAILPVLVTNDASQPVPAQEVNTDADHNIKVHEQGTANVNVTGGTVNALSDPPSQRVTRVATSQTIPANTAWHTGYRNTSDCRALAAFVTADFSIDNGDVGLWMSPGGGEAVSVAYTTEGTARRVQQAWYFTAGSIPVFAPTAEVVVVNGHDSPGTLNGAWLVCSR